MAASANDVILLTHRHMRSLLQSDQLRAARDFGHDTCAHPQWLFSAQLFATLAGGETMVICCILCAANGRCAFAAPYAVTCTRPGSFSHHSATCLSVIDNPVQRIWHA